MENNTPFKEGDRVRLKTGKTKMWVNMVVGEMVQVKIETDKGTFTDSIHYQALEHWTDKDNDKGLISCFEILKATFHEGSFFLCNYF